MPELPEVESAVRCLSRHLLGDSFIGVSVLWDRMIACPEVESFRASIKHKRIEEIARRGKYILVRLSSEETLIMHLRMSGHLHLLSKGQRRHKHDRVLFSLGSERRLCFQDARKFGRLYLVENTKVLVFDTTSANSAKKTGAASLLESLMIWNQTCGLKIQRQGGRVIVSNLF